MKMILILLFVTCFVLLLSNADDSSYDFFQGIGGPLVKGVLTLGNIQDMFRSGFGDFCNQTSMCKLAYADCVNNTCLCKNGFTKSSSGKCTPNNYFCPDLAGGVPKPQPRSTLRYCYVDSRSSQTFGCSKDNTSAEFCFLHPRSRTNGNYSIGHCCPKPQLTSMITSSVCPLEYGNSPYLPCSSCTTIYQSCLSIKHWTSQTSFTYNGQCCPLPCPSSKDNQTISIDGQCYFTKNFGEECQKSGQCKTLDSVCYGSGGAAKTCTCRRGFLVDADVIQCLRKNETATTQ